MQLLHNRKGLQKCTLVTDMEEDEGFSDITVPGLEVLQVPASPTPGFCTITSGLGSLADNTSSLASSVSTLAITTSSMAPGTSSLGSGTSTTAPSRSTLVPGTSDMTPSTSTLVPGTSTLIPAVVLPVSAVQGTNPQASAPITTVEAGATPKRPYRRTVEANTCKRCGQFCTGRSQYSASTMAECSALNLNFFQKTNGWRK
ncbi:putative protein TPRXL isoform X1 [Thunnus maccoyii]|uniref:putative protein TPRXL isoform X1 n=1 Tax=Thunnus maccoyii TaxID=8240 RepID=UPI001C4CFC38|nr:putative protein TPRXL isoform X1 [Thunnus maccoyii]XP_042246303.1 putative protein TPRXL isoform X1 [Thunnus maccoyii]